MNIEELEKELINKYSWLTNKVKESQEAGADWDYISYFKTKADTIQEILNLLK